MAIRVPVVPEYITVHLGAPDEPARNITVPFIEYIKNVASGEIYSTWPTDSLKANILAIISFTLNRIYNEWYPSKGYNFDITSSSKYDQSFVENRQFFENITVIVDDIFNNYIRKGEQIQPLYASYCDGKNTTCDGLSQWGTVSLANKGYDPLQILRNYYGNDVQIVFNAPVSNDVTTYPGYDLRLGDFDNSVGIIKTELNRISRNYPAIPKIEDMSALYNVELENAVRKFQEIFDLKVTGTVDKSTWYKIKYLYNAVKKISSLYSEGISIEEAELIFPGTQQLGNTSKYIRAINYYLNVIAYFDNTIPFLDLKGETFNERTEEAVKAFQRAYGIEPTGIVDTNTWKYMRQIYLDTLKNIPREYFTSLPEFYPGFILSYGMTGDNILRLQKYLYTICSKKHEIPGVRVNGIFDDLTLQSVKYLQRKFGLEDNGLVGSYTWYYIVEYSKEI